MQSFGSLAIAYDDIWGFGRQRDFFEPYLEIETALLFPKRLQTAFITSAEAHRHKVGSNFGIPSVYSDTPNMTIWAIGWSFRIRDKGVVLRVNPATGASYTSQSFPMQLAIKRRLHDMQAAGHALVRELYPRDWKQYAGMGIRASFRDENEGPAGVSINARELHFNDLPTIPYKGHENSLSKVIAEQVLEGNFEGISKPEEIIVSPRGVTLVDRAPVKMYFSPNEQYDFLEFWPSMAPTPEMLASGRYVAIEVALDDCHLERPVKPNILTIGEIFEASRWGNRDKIERLGTNYLFEYEVVQAECGPNTTNADIVRCFIECGLAVYRFAEAVDGELVKEIRPAGSKALNLYGAMTECQEGGRLHRAYIEGARLAP